MLAELSRVAKPGVPRYNGGEIRTPLYQGLAMATGSTFATDLRYGQEWKDMLEEILPPQGRWSEEEYLILTDHRNRLIEFTDGFLEVLPLPTDKHQSVLKFLFSPFTLSSRFAVARSGSRRCDFELGKASTVSPTFWRSFPPPITVAKIDSGRGRPRSGSGE